MKFGFLDDKVIVAVLIGFIATIPFELFTRVMLLFGIGKYSVYELTSLIITTNRPNFILGAVMSCVVGGTIAIIVSFVLKKWVANYLILKSLGISLLSWVLMESEYTWLIEGRHLIKPRPISDYYSEMIGSLIFGFFLGLLLKKLVFKNPVSHER